MSRNRERDETDKQTRIAIVNSDKCKPKRCRQECKKSCPVVRMGKLCIEVSQDSKIASLSEELCIGCGICVKVNRKSSNILCIKNVNIFVSFRNVRLRPSLSLMFQVIWINIQHIAILRIRLNCIDCQHLDQGKSLD